jgi:uncharacterized membrane protein YkvA (DUF1232 family)
MKSYGKRGFEKYLPRATAFIDDSKKAGWLLEKAIFKSKKSSFSAIRGLKNIKWMIMLFKDWLSGRYREISRATILSAAAAILYFVSPVDLVLDFIPFGGYIDDAAVIGFVFNKISDDVEKYRIWRNSKNVNEEL